MEFKLSSDKKELLKYEGNSKFVTIPDDVECINSQAFENNSTIEQVTLPFSIRKICTKAFLGCKNLKSIQFKSIPADYSGCSFCNCKSLNETIIHNGTLIRVPLFTSGKYTVPDNVTKISKGAFCDCTNITDLVITNGVKRIEELAFNGLLNLKSISISSSVEFIAERAFIDCGKVKSITIDKSNPKYDSRDNCNAIVDTESNRIIFGCSNTSFVNTITSIGNSAFAFCSNLEEIRLPDTITQVDHYAFQNCCNLKYAELPSSLKSVTSGIFQDCKNLDRIVLNEGIVTIDFQAFKGCDKLSSINIPNTFVPNNSNCLFYFSEMVESITVPIYNKYNFIYLPKSYTGHYAIPEGIKCVIAGAFLDCDKLTGVSVPNSLREISASAFEGCSSLSEIKGSKAISLIRNNAFTDCKELSSIDLSNIEIIEDDAFMNCCRLNTIIINNQISISGNPFRLCPNINIHIINNTLFNPIIPEDGHFIVPPSVEHIAPGAFENCSELKSITIPNEVTIGVEAFSGCINLQTVSLPKKLKELPQGIFKGCKALKTILLPKGITTIGDEAFKGCESLETITIPNKVSVLGFETFAGCINITTICWDINSSKMTEIGCSAFKGCKQLKFISIPRNLSVVKSGAFKDCVNLSDIMFWGGTLKELGDSAFEGCSSLKGIDIPYGITNIQYYTFKDCCNLRCIIIPHSVKSINPSAFMGCTNIETAEMSNAWNRHREELGLPPARPSCIDYDENEPLTGLGASEDGPMLCTEGQMWPCPYCGSNDVQTYIDGTAQCNHCNRWYKYTQSWL